MSILREKIINVDSDQENQGGAGSYMATIDVISEEQESHISEDSLTQRKVMRE